MLPTPTVPAVLDQRVDDLSAIGQEHIGNGALILVEAVCLEGDCLAIDEY